MRVHTRRSAALTAATAAVTVALAGTGPAGGAPTPAARAAAANVRVGTYNVVNVSTDKNDGNRKPWRKRRNAVVRTILAEQVDVIGVQEVNPSQKYQPDLKAGRNQYMDLLKGLNSHGGNYRLVNKKGYNCERAWTSYRCEYRNRNASGSDRIYYRPAALTRIGQGAMRYTEQADTRSPEHLAWAVFRVNATGQEFLFATTHLEPKNVGIRAAQWQQLIDQVNTLKGTRPVIVTGDFNTHKYADLAARMYPAMRDAGYGEVLNQQYRTNPTPNPRTNDRVNGWVNSYNHWDRDVADFGYEDSREKTGNTIDLIFASNELPVQQYKVAVNYDPADLRLNGVVPSDHNMLRATVTLP